VNSGTEGTADVAEPRDTGMGGFGDRALTVEVKDRPGCAGTALCQAAPSGVTSASGTASVLPSGTVGTLYGPVQLQATDGAAPYKWKLNGSKLPSGLKLASTGIITGTPKVAGPATITVKATDAKKGTAVAAFTLTIS
jgi:hypothetical protein